MRHCALRSRVDAVSKLDLQPLARLNEDEVRIRIDESLAKVLGLPSIAPIRELLAREPGLCARLLPRKVQNLFRVSTMSEITYYVALPFVAADDGVAAGEQMECFNPNAAVMRAEAFPSGGFQLDQSHLREQHDTGADRKLYLYLLEVESTPQGPKTIPRHSGDFPNQVWNPK